jgi:hypothetical protein
MEQYEFLMMMVLPVALFLTFVRNHRVSKIDVLCENDSDDGQERDYIQVREHDTRSERTTGLSLGTIKAIG